MAKRRNNTIQSSASIVPMFAPDIVHTVELQSLLGMLRELAPRWSAAVTHDTSEWHGWMGYFEALKAAELGQWDAPEIASLTLPELTSASDDMRYFHDFTGAQLDIAAYCSGEPEYWQDAEPINKPCGRIIRLAIGIGGAATLTAQSLRNRGEAIIALVNSLELQGHSVEVSISRAFGNVKTSNHYKFLIPLKHAGQALDTKRFQFMIGHPAFFRRCLLAFSDIAQGSDGMTVAENFAPEGYVFVSCDAGLTEFSHESMGWAKQFAHSLTETQN